MRARVGFRGMWLAYLLVAPQLVVTLVFFIWPSAEAIEQSLYLQDSWGFSREFVGLRNYDRLWEDEAYLRSFWRSFLFSGWVTLLAMGLGLVFALAADRALRAAAAYKSLLIWPYAVAPALAGALWYFMLNPSVGVFALWLKAAGVEWNHYSNADQAFVFIVIAAVWRQISYNFLFFLAGLQSIPRSLIEAAAIDNAGPWRRFWTVTAPLLSPTIFFLFVINLVYAFFDTFAIIHATTGGAPGDATATLIYRVYNIGFEGQNYGRSAAEGLVLMVLVIIMAVIQFRYVERRVSYQ